MTTRLKLSTQRGTGDLPVVTAVGEIDMSNAASFREALAQAAPDGGRFAVDLTAVQYLDNAGLNALFVHMSRIQVIASPLLTPLLTVSGLACITSVRQPQDQASNG